MDNDLASSSRKSPKSILKPSSSFDQQEKPSKHKNAKWDEMNILATFHPADKDYGHMKVEEPKTPFNWDVDRDDTDGPPPLDPSVLNEKLTSVTASTSRRRSTPSLSEETSDSESDTSGLDESELARRREFKNRRQKHYNEFKAVQLARRLIAEEAEEEDEPEGCHQDSKEK